MGFSKGTTPGPWEEVEFETPLNTPIGGGSSPTPEITKTENHGDESNTPPPTSNNTFSTELLKVQPGEYSKYVAKQLSYISGWSYSDFDTFKDQLADQIGPHTDIVEIQVKNEPMTVEATAQVIRTSDKKVMIVAFRGTEVTNPINWITDAIAKKTNFFPSSNDESSKNVQVHTGFKTNFEKVWLGQKGVLMHLLIPDMMNIEYDYSKLPGSSQQPPSCRNNEQDLLEAIYITGHSLGGAMAFLAGLWLGAQQHNNVFASLLFSKLRGVYTYGAPMVIDNHARTYCQNLVGYLNFRHVYYNDIVPHLPPLSAGGFDHVGVEFRYHPRHGWVSKQDEGLLPETTTLPCKSDGRCTQVPSLIFTGTFGLLDGILDQINWFNFIRGEDRDVPIIGTLSRGYIKCWWSFLDHSPSGYIESLSRICEGEEKQKYEEEGDLFFHASDRMDTDGTIVSDLDEAHSPEKTTAAAMMYDISSPPIRKTSSSTSLTRDVL